MSRLPYIMPQYLNNVAEPLLGGYLTFKASGTNNDKATYQDAELSVANPAELPLTSGGRPTFPIFLDSGSYDIFLYDADDVLIAQDLGVNGTGNSGTQTRITVNNMEELRGLFPASADVVEVLGYYEAGDKAGVRTFTWSNTVTEDGGYNIKVNAGGAGGYVAIPSGEVTPYHFGAKGDGVEDDTVPFQNMLDFNSNVYLPEGFYRITNTLSFTDTDPAPVNDPDRRWGTNITGAGQTKTWIYGKEIVGPLFTHPENTWPNGLTHARTYLSDFTLTGSNDYPPSDVANMSTTLAGIIGNSTSGQMTAGIIAERVRIWGIATTEAKAWDLSQMFEVTLRNCHTQDIHNGYAYFGQTGGERATTIQIHDSYATVVKQVYAFYDIGNVTFSGQCIFESCDCVGTSFWTNITFYDPYLEDIGNGTGTGIPMKTLGQVLPNTAPYDRLVDTAFYDVGGTLTFIGAEFTQISPKLTAFFQGVGQATGFSSGGKVSFINCRSSMTGRTLFNEDGRLGYVYEVNDQCDRYAFFVDSNGANIQRNYNMIKTLSEARKLTFGRGRVISTTLTNLTSSGQSFTASNSSGSLLLTFSNTIDHLQKVKFNGTGTLPTGLVANTAYWIIQISATTARVGTTENNAFLGTAIAYTDSGSGVNIVSNIYDLNQRWDEVFEVKNTLLTLGFNPDGTYSTKPYVYRDEYFSYLSGDSVILNSNGYGIASKMLSIHKRTGTLTSGISAGGIVANVADTNSTRLGAEIIIKLAGAGAKTTTQATNVGSHLFKVASTSGISIGDKITLAYTSPVVYTFTSTVIEILNGTDFLIKDPIFHSFPLGGSLNIVEGYHITSVAYVIDSTSFMMADPIPSGRSSSSGAEFINWAWIKAGYGQIINEKIEYLTSPKFTGGVSFGQGDSPLNLDNGLDDDINAPAMKITQRRYIEFLNNNGLASKSSPIGVNPNGDLTIGNGGESKFRATPEGLVFGPSIDDAALICGDGVPGTGQTFTASDSSGLLLTYTNNIPNYHRVRFTTTTTLPTGLSTGTDYFIIKVSDTTCRVATSRANAIAGTAIAYTDAGTGTHTVQLAHKKGSIYSRLDGSSTSTRMYVNTDGAFAWTNITTAT